MLDIFRSLKSLIKISHIHIDSAVFRLHYSLTVILLIAFSLIVTTRQYVGNPIDCIHSKDLPEDVLNTYCWIHSTYTITAAYRKKEGYEVPFPGIDNSKSYPESERKEYRYYQWVCFMLFLQVHRIAEDSMMFRLHYRATVAVLLAGCLTLACKSISGSPIHCEANGSVDKAVLETFCWLHTTYSMVRAFNLSMGQAVPYPGVSNSKGDGMHGHAPHPLVKQHKYYQWVIFFLLLQAILFYTPRWLWKGWEGGKIHALMMDLDIGLCSEVEKKQKKKMLLDYLWENLRYHNWWAYRYYLCEVLALLNVIGQMFLMNRFFDGAFLTFGIDVLRFLESDQEDRVDPMIYVFPRMTKCTFYKYGVSGEVERHDAVCILPLNVVNEKIYVFLWFWFLFLGVLSFFTVLYRVNPDHIFAAHEGLPVANEISSGPEGRCGDHSSSQQGGRLVSPLHARREFGHRDIPRRDARIGEQTRLEASPWRTRSEGRASRSLIEVASESRHVRFAVAIVAILSSSTVRIARSSTHPTQTQPGPERTTDQRAILEDPRRWIRSREDVSRPSFPPAVAHRTRSDATAIAPDVGDVVSFPSSLSLPPYHPRASRGREGNNAPSHSLGN